MPGVFGAGKIDDEDRVSLWLVPDIYLAHCALFVVLDYSPQDTLSECERSQVILMRS